VFSVIVLVLEITIYLVILWCTISLLMGKFYVDNKYIPLRRNKSLGDQGYVVFFFLLCDGKWCEQCKTIRGVEFSKLNILFLVIIIVGFCCVGLVLFEEMDIGMSAHEMQLTFFDYRNSATLELGTECWSLVGF